MGNVSTQATRFHDPRSMFSDGAFGNTLRSDVLRAMVRSHCNASREHIQIFQELS